MRFTSGRQVRAANPGSAKTAKSVSFRYREEQTMQQIIPFLWFNGDAEEAVNYYASLFPNSKIERISRYGEGGRFPAGTAMVIEFQLDGQDMMALNGGQGPEKPRCSVPGRRGAVHQLRFASSSR